MRASFVARDWLVALKIVSAIIPKRVTNPTLRSFKVEVRADGTVRLSANDLNQARAAIVLAEVEAGTILVPAAQFVALLSHMPPDTRVCIETTGDGFVITAGTGTWRLPKLPHEVWPELPGPDLKLAASFALTAADARRVVQRVVHAACTDGVRFYLNGLYVHPLAGQIAVVGTDGHRLARVLLNVDPGNLQGAILPLSAVEAMHELARLPGDDDLRIRIDDTKLELSRGSHQVISRLVDGKYPTYKHTIPPATGANRVEVVARDLAAAVERLVAVGADVRSIGLQWSRDNGALTICLARDQRAGREELSVKQVSGTGKVALQSYYLLDAVQALATEFVTIAHNGGGEPVLLTGADADALAVVMPTYWSMEVVDDQPVPPTRMRTSRG